MNWNMSPKYAVEGSAGLLCQPKTKSSSTFFLLEAAWVCEKQNQKHKPPKQQLPPKNTNPTNNKHQTTPSNTVMIARPRVKYETICFFHRLPRSVKARAVRIGSYATERCTKWTSYTVYGTWYSVGRHIKTSKQGNKHNKTKGHPQKCTSRYNSRYATTVIHFPHLDFAEWSGYASLHPAEEHLRGIWGRLRLHALFHAVSQRRGLVKLLALSNFQACRLRKHLMSHVVPDESRPVVVVVVVYLLKLVQSLVLLFCLLDAHSCHRYVLNDYSAPNSCLLVLCTVNHLTPEWSSRCWLTRPRR